MLSGAVTVFSDSRPVISVSRPVISVSRLAFPLAALVIVRAATAFTGITHRLLYRYMQKTARPCGIPHTGSKKPGSPLRVQIYGKAGAETRENRLSSWLVRNTPAFSVPSQPEITLYARRISFFGLREQKNAIFVLQNTPPLVSKIKTPHKENLDKRHYE